MHIIKNGSVGSLALGIVASLGLGGALGACGDDGDDKAPAMSGEDYDEVATTMGALVADEARGEQSAFGGAVLLSRGIVPDDFELTGGIAVGDLLGVDYSFTVVCHDDHGARVDCGAAAYSADIDISWSGDWTTTNVDASSDFEGDWTLSGLANDLILIDGTADGQASLLLTQDNGNQRTWSVDYAATYDGVGVDADSRRAVSGVVRYRVDLDRSFDGRVTDTERHFSVDAEVSFQNDGTATLVLDGDQVYRMRRNGSVELVARGTLE